MWHTTLQFLDYVGKAVFTTIIELDKFQRPETSKIEKVRIWTLDTMVQSVCNHFFSISKFSYLNMECPRRTRPITNISNKFAICICTLKLPKYHRAEGSSIRFFNCTPTQMSFLYSNNSRPPWLKSFANQKTCQITEWFFSMTTLWSIRI